MLLLPDFFWEKSFLIYKEKKLSRLTLLTTHQYPLVWALDEESFRQIFLIIHYIDNKRYPKINTCSGFFPPKRTMCIRDLENLNLKSVSQIQINEARWLFSSHFWPLLNRVLFLGQLGQ